jgi:hypothetical protein
VNEQIVIAVEKGTITTPIQSGVNVLSDSSKLWRNSIFRNFLVRVTSPAGKSELAIIDDNSSNCLVIRGIWLSSFPIGSAYAILGLGDLRQALRDVFGGGADISAANPLETHDPKVEDVEDKLDHPTYGLAALKAALDSLAGGAFYGSYGPKNVEVDNDVDFGIILYDPAGNIITTGEITPGTYTVHRVRGAVDTEIVATTASSEAAGRVYMTYDFPAANWAVGDIFYVTFSGITVTIDGVTTEYPDLYIWGRVVREADISSKVDAVEAKLDLATPGGTFSYLDAGGEQTIFTFTPTKDSIIHCIWLDLFTLTQNSTIRLKHQIDGATYRTFETFNWTTGMDDGVYFRNIAVMAARPIQVTMQETADEGADRDVPYYYVYEERA